MTYRSISILFVLPLWLFWGCRHKAKSTYTYRYPGYYFHLLSFSTDSFTYQPGKVAWVAVTFKTQSDSIFWDSYNNLNDRFFAGTDSGTTVNCLRHFISGAAVGDSACLLIPPVHFFMEQFGSDSIPFFCRGDTAVKVNLKVKGLMSQEEFRQRELNLRQEEQDQIERFFGSPQQMELARDPLGFYWITRPVPSNGPGINEGDQLTIAYKGYFLNGRLFESPASSFEFIYGTPDQVLKGLNYVSGKLKLGQTAKILLPSRLAFGENGSSNGSVPLFTPLIYELKIIDVKKLK